MQTDSSTLKEKLRSPDADVRRSAIREIKGILNLELYELINKSLKDDNEETRLHAADILLKGDKEFAEAVFLEALNNEKAECFSLVLHKILQHARSARRLIAPNLESKLESIYPSLAMCNQIVCLCIFVYCGSNDAQNKLNEFGKMVAGLSVEEKEIFLSAAALFDSDDLRGQTVLGCNVKTLADGVSTEMKANLANLCEFLPSHPDIDCLLMEWSQSDDMHLRQNAVATIRSKEK